MKIIGLRINPILVILVGVLISGFFLIAHGFHSARSTLTGLGHSLIITAGIWMGCMSIVGWLWKKYPWEFYPVKHLIIEIVLITVYTITFSSGLYFIEIRLGLYVRQDILLFDA
ncbi:MAG: hypothetical protein KAT15_21695, partial [Bacteroidales bacterium]|nr:hypothetical protein [Bacteroidales bacterium]